MDVDTQTWYLDRAKSLVEVLERGEGARAEAILGEIERRHCSESFEELERLSERLQSLLSRSGLDVRLSDLTDRDIPDARERLKYVIATTETAANGTLGHVEACLPVCDRLIAFVDEWDGQLDDRVVSFLDELPEQIRSLRQALNEIMLAQSFQDITGQILKQVIEVVCEIERALESMIGERPESPGLRSLPRAGRGPDKDTGPAVPGCHGAPRVSGQDEIDDLLSGLGV